MDVLQIGIVFQGKSRGARSIAAHGFRVAVWPLPRCGRWASAHRQPRLACKRVAARCLPARGGHSCGGRRCAVGIGHEEFPGTCVACRAPDSAPTVLTGVVEGERSLAADMAIEFRHRRRTLQCTAHIMSIVPPQLRSSTTLALDVRGSLPIVDSRTSLPDFHLRGGEVEAEPAHQCLLRALPRTATCVATGFPCEGPSLHRPTPAPLLADSRCILAPRRFAWEHRPLGPSPLGLRRH